MTIILGLLQVSRNLLMQATAMMLCYASMPAIPTTAKYSKNNMQFYFLRSGKLAIPTAPENLSIFAYKYSAGCGGEHCPQFQQH
jgi:hypothetical protein